MSQVYLTFLLIFPKNFLGFPSILRHPQQVAVLDRQLAVFHFFFLRLCLIRQQVLNGFIFNGKQVIKPEMLADTNTSSYYKANGEIHGQDRDVAKLLTIDKTKVIISLVGIENQTRPDKYMPARVMNYDAAAYRYQLTKRKTLYPVLTLVVYYGKEAWSYNRNLLGNINMQKLPKEMQPLISDYEIKAFYRISDLSAQELDKRFRSAFFCLAEYFIQTNAGEEYHPSAKKLSIEDILLLLDMMNALSGTMLMTS